MQDHKKQRQQVLETLYASREQEPKFGWVAEADLKDAVGDIAFALSVLTELGFVKRDGYRLMITGSGVMACEQGRD